MIVGFSFKLSLIISHPSQCFQYEAAGAAFAELGEFLFIEDAEGFDALVHPFLIQISQFFLHDRFL